MDEHEATVWADDPAEIRPASRSLGPGFRSLSPEASAEFFRMLDDRNNPGRPAIRIAELPATEAEARGATAMDEHEAVVRADDATPSTGGRVADLLRENAALRAEREAILGLLVQPRGGFGGFPRVWRVVAWEYESCFPTRAEAVADVLRLAAETAAEVAARESAGESAKGGDADGRD